MAAICGFVALAGSPLGTPEALDLAGRPESLAIIVAAAWWIAERFILLWLKRSGQIDKATPTAQVAEETRANRAMLHELQDDVEKLRSEAAAALMILRKASAHDHSAHEAVERIEHQLALLPQISSDLRVLLERTRHNGAGP